VKELIQANASYEMRANITVGSGPRESCVNLFHTGERRLIISILGQRQSLATPILSKSFPQDLHGTLSSRQKMEADFSNRNYETHDHNALVHHYFIGVQSAGGTE
jgi:hypothetical protein